MKNLFAFLAVLGMLSFGASEIAFAQEDAGETTEQAPGNSLLPVGELDPEAQPLHQEIKRIFIEGGAGFMGVVLLALIFGLAIAIERILYLNFATTNTEKLIAGR
jgi:biopolymer transport protein ExbB